MDSILFSSLYDDSSSDDDRNTTVERKNKVFKMRINNLNLWDEQEFIARYRVSKEVALLLTHKIENEIKFATEKNRAVKPNDQVLSTLQYYASGSFMRCVGDMSGLHKSTVCRIIHRVTRAIAKLRPEYLNMPRNNEELLAVATDFYKIARFPKVLGAIDCTHIQILSPGGQNAEDFRNRKGTFSINVQVVGDANLFIRNIVARWPGSAHDSHIFNSSNLKCRLESGEFDNYWLLGDSGYALKSYMLTPLHDPQTQAEKYYNERQIRSRNTIERLFGLWKRRFPIIGTKLRSKLENIQHIIVATAVLHNICRKLNVVQLPDNVQINEEMHGASYSITNSNVDSTTRNYLINNYFNRCYYFYLNKNHIYKLIRTIVYYGVLGGRY